jgi:hypothetical protein
MFYEHHQYLLFQTYYSLKDHLSLSSVLVSFLAGVTQNGLSKTNGIVFGTIYSKLWYQEAWI